MHTLLISYYPNPTSNLIECTKNDSGVKTLTVIPHALRVVSNATQLGLHLTLTLRCKLSFSLVFTWHWHRKQNNILVPRVWSIQSKALVGIDYQTTKTCDQDGFSPLSEIKISFKFKKYNKSQKKNSLISQFLSIFADIFWHMCKNFASFCYVHC